MSLKSVDEVISQMTLPAPLECPNESVPDRPDITVPQLLHRSHDGYVNITRKVNGTWQELGNIKATELRGLFAQEAFQDAVDQNGYYSLHGMFNHGKRRGRNTHPMLAPHLRKIQSLRWLTSCHVDLDAYKLGIDKHAAYAAVMRLVEAGRIPAPSVFTLSQGVWAIWLLRDRLDPHSPVRCYPHEKVYEWWDRLQRELHERCSEIGSDPSTKHGATVTRIPGSINTKAGFSRVGYMIPADTRGNVFQYTLEEMDNFLRPGRPKHRTVEGRTNRKPNLIKARGWRGRWSTLLTRLERLRNHRQGWKVGTRDNALLFVATALKGMKATKEQAASVMREHVADMEQPTGDRITMNDAMWKWMKASFENGGASNQTVADSLGVTVDEAAMLSSKKSVFPPARSHQGKLPLLIEKASQADQRRHRRQLISELHAIQTQASGTVSGHLMKDLLEGHGCTATVKTIIKDMRELGLYSERLKPADAPDKQLRLSQ